MFQTPTVIVNSGVKHHKPNQTPTVSRKMKILCNEKKSTPNTHQHELLNCIQFRNYSFQKPKKKCMSTIMIHIYIYK